MLTLNDGRTELWQWDTKRTLTVDADCSQVHFSNKVFGRSIDMDVVDGVASIPDVLLQTDKDLTAWAFVGTAENGYTKISKVFKVNKRNKPADYVFTPQDQTTLEEITERLEDLEIQKPTAGFVKTVNGIEPDENGNIDVPMGTGSAVQYVAQTLTYDQKMQARENIGAMAADATITLSKEQVNALDAMFRVVAYTEDVSEKYRNFRVVFGIVNPNALVVEAIKFGVVGFDSGHMSLNTQDRFKHRATAVPIGMYLKNGKTYRLSIGSLGDRYKFGFKVYAAPGPDMEFPYAVNGEVTLFDVTEMIFASDWIATEYNYTVEQENCILAVNFACISGRNFEESDYAEILENFVIEES